MPADDNDTKIDELRRGIDDIDNEILDLLNRRLELALEIGRAKAVRGAQVLDNLRETKIFERLSALNKGPMTDPMIEDVYREIIQSSRKTQKSHRVSYLGPEATFTHIAAMKHFGSYVSFIPQQKIPDVFQEVEKGACKFGVVPVENSIEGAVNHTLDQFYESDLKICAERYQLISHDLLTKAGRLEDIKTVYSHPQALAQCSRWLRKYLPDVALEECGSTAHAAQKASGKPETAAIAGSEAAHMYQLEVLASKIEDTSRNTTRFLIIGRDKIPPTGDDKTSLMFVTSHIPGALYKALKPLSDSGINMVKLESRPTKHENWSYFFFVDMQGHIENPIVKETVLEMKSLCLFLRHLGSYPRDKQGHGDTENGL